MCIHIYIYLYGIFTVRYVSATDFCGFRGTRKKAKASAEGPIARASSPGLEAGRSTRSGKEIITLQ